MLIIIDLMYVGDQQVAHPSGGQSQGMEFIVASKI
jgi:hypothetical protein